jgi:hypothetical protein
MKFVLCEERIDGLTLPTVQFKATSLSKRVKGRIANSCDENTERLRDWKRKVAKCTKDERGNQYWDDKKEYVISLGFSFCLAQHGGGTLDVENYVKPILDAIAAGLFCDLEVDPQTIDHFGYNDSGFQHFFVTSFDVVDKEEDEGVVFFVSVR